MIAENEIYMERNHDDSDTDPARVHASVRKIALVMFLLGFSIVFFPLPRCFATLPASRRQAGVRQGCNMTNCMSNTHSLSS